MKNYKDIQNTIVKNKLMSLVKSTKNYNDFINSCNNSNCVSPKTEIISKGQLSNPPLYLDLGVMYPVNAKGLHIPQLACELALPYADYNAVLFDSSSNKEANKFVQDYFQKFILTIASSMRLKSFKCYSIDMQYGASMSSLNSIKNGDFKINRIFNKDKVYALLTDLGDIIHKVSTECLGKYKSLFEYNIAENTSVPYHFVFIDDFPSAFDTRSIEMLFDMISRDNASKAGVHIFINYNQRTEMPRGYDVNKFKNKCLSINLKDKAKIEFSNYPITLSDKVLKLEPKFTLPIADKIIDKINSTKEESSSTSLDLWIKELVINKQIWKSSTIEGIDVPIGFLQDQKTFNFYLANDLDGNCNDFFSLIAGKPGSGKTVLLHNIIVNSCMKYSPKELTLYLADFAEGASFSIYKNLPHVKALMLANNKEYALRILLDLVNEAKNRSRLYQQAQSRYGKQITTLSVYRQVTGEALPRILLVMDEFHFLFNTTDEISIRAKEELCNGIRQWRKFGISIILCTQTISGVNFGDADNIITYRFALELLESDSKSVIRNSAAMSLKRKGQTIMNNTSDGNPQYNVEFQCSYSPNYLQYVNFLYKVYLHNYKIERKPYICEYNINVDVNENVTLATQLKNNTFTIDNLTCSVYIGKPDLLRERHTRILYRRLQNSNTLFIGEDFKSTIFSFAMHILQIIRQSASNSKIYIIDCFNTGDTYKDCFSPLLKNTINIQIKHNQEIDNCLSEISLELEKRKELQLQGKFTEERIFLFIINTQNCYSLKPINNGTFKMPSQASKQLTNILENGSPLGIHSVIHTLNFSNFFGNDNSLDSRVVDFFENKVLLKGCEKNYLYMGGVKIPEVEREGQMIVLNAKIDNEPYEQSNCYSEISLQTGDTLCNNVRQILDKYRNE